MADKSRLKERGRAVKAELMNIAESMEFTSPTEEKEPEKIEAPTSTPLPPPETKPPYQIKEGALRFETKALCLSDDVRVIMVNALEDLIERHQKNIKKGYESANELKNLAKARQLITTLKCPVAEATKTA